MSSTLRSSHTVVGRQIPSAPRVETRVRIVAIAGNPNSGKSTLFNALTGLRQKVGNYPGVTVEKKIGRFHGSHGEAFDLLDLPGTYSLQTRSPDEAVARDVLLGRRDDTPSPDVILCVVDATNLERNLYVVAQLTELGLPLVVALVMMDLAERDGWVINVPELSRRLGCPVVPTVAAQGKGLVELRQAITRQFQGFAPHRATLPPVVEDWARRVSQELIREEPAQSRFALAEAILLVSGTKEQAEAAPAAVQSVLTQARRAIEAAGVDAISVTVHARYAWV